MTIVILLEQLFKINEEIRAKSNHDKEVVEVCRRRISNAEVCRNIARRRHISHAVYRRRHHVDKTKKKTI